MSEQATGNKIVLLGDSGVGKTCLISRFISGQFDANVNSTNGASYASKKVDYPDLGTSLVLDIWDTAGQEKYKSLTKFFYKDAAMVILVYDITRKESYDNLKNFWYKEILEYGEKDIVLGIAGNKSDLYDEEAKIYKPWEIYWVLEGMQKLGMYDKEKQVSSSEKNPTLWKNSP